MDFSLPPDIEAMRVAIRAFVDNRIIPLESDPASYDAHENLAPALLDVLRAEAKARGLWALQMPVARGGRGLGMTGMAACYEEMNRSIFGPVVFNSAAPDDGNMMLLEKIGTPEQKARWLQPIVDGAVHCPWHHARYDVHTGAMTRGPQGAFKPVAGLIKGTAGSIALKTYPVELRDGAIWLS